MKRIRLPAWLAAGVVLQAAAARAMVVVTNAGTMQLGGVREMSVPVINRSAAAWSITAAVCSCACVTVTAWPRTVAAGSSAVVRMSLRAEMPGSFGYVISLIDEQRGGPIYKIIINVVVANVVEEAKRDRRWTLDSGDGTRGCDTVFPGFGHSCVPCRYAHGAVAVDAVRRFVYNLQL